MKFGNRRNCDSCLVGLTRASSEVCFNKDYYSLQSYCISCNGFDHLTWESDVVRKLPPVFRNRLIETADRNIQMSRECEEVLFTYGLRYFPPVKDVDPNWVNKLFQTIERG